MKESKKTDTRTRKVNSETVCRNLWFVQSEEEILLDLNGAFLSFENDLKGARCSEIQYEQDTGANEIN